MCQHNHRCHFKPKLPLARLIRGLWQEHERFHCVNGESGGRTDDSHLNPEEDRSRPDLAGRRFDGSRITGFGSKFRKSRDQLPELILVAFLTNTLDSTLLDPASNDPDLQQTTSDGTRGDTPAANREASESVR